MAALQEFNNEIESLLWSKNVALSNLSLNFTDVIITETK